MVLILHLLWWELAYSFTCGRRSLVSGTQNDMVVS